MDTKEILTNKSFCVLPWTGLLEHYKMIESRTMHLNIFNLPNKILYEIKEMLSLKIKTSSYYLKNSYENILKYITDTPWDKDINSFKKNILLLHIRRKILAKKTFHKLFKELGNV